MGTLKVNGNISATGTISATSFLGHASSATVARFLSSHDTRNDSIEPNQMKANEAVQFDFKADSTINLTDAPYSGVMSYRPYSTSSDWTGGPAHQLAFNSAGLYWRQSSGNTWLGWNKLIHSGNYTDYTVTKTGSGASGTWGINITGNATYATSASRLYSTDNSYKYGSANPYYGYLTYSDPYWDFKVSPATPADVRVSRAYTAGSADSANWASGASYAERVAGYYTGNGGAQGPSYIGRGNVKFNMMNQFPNAGTTNYMDCILMNTYGGGDVPRATAFGIERYTGRAWIAEGSDTSSTWAQVYEVISTRNIGSQSVNYANTAGWASSAGNADRVYPINSNPNNSHPGYGLKVFYSWDQGQVGNDNGGYANGITIGSHPSDQAYGFQIVQNMWDDRTYTRRYNQGWQSWKTLAWTDDLAAYLPLSGGTMTGNLNINTHGNTMTIGSLNSAWCHFQSSADIPFYFNRRVFVDGCLGIYEMNSQGCGSSFPSNPSKGQIFFKI